MSEPWEGRDLWWEARSRTRATVAIGQMGALIYPEAGYEGSVIVPDLNKYRPGVDLRALYAMGIRHIILRMGGPLQFVYDNWRMTEDPTWRSYYAAARAAGFTSIGGYVIYVAGIDDQNYSTSPNMLDFINQVTSSGCMPDYIIVDDEVNTWWQNGIKVTATPVNQVRGLKALLPNIWNRFRKPPMHYSARWFMSQNADYWTQYVTWLDNANGTSDGKTVLNWYAWYLNAFEGKTDVYVSADAIRNKLVRPTSDQVANYLQVGSHSLYDLHQFTSTLHMTGTGVEGFDCSVSRLSENEFLASINLGPTPPPPPPPPPPTGCGKVLAPLTRLLHKWS